MFSTLAFYNDNLSLVIHVSNGGGGDNNKKTIYYQNAATGCIESKLNIQGNIRQHKVLWHSYSMEHTHTLLYRFAYELSELLKRY